MTPRVVAEVSVVCGSHRRTAKVEHFLLVSGGLTPGWRTKVSQRTQEHASPADGAWRYRLVCRLCGLNVTVRASTLHPVLDRLADAGVAHVDLATLNAIVGRRRRT
jgi:hypothetical protein